MRVVRTILIVAGAQSGHAQNFPANFPAKPVRIVTTVPGGGLDIAARIIAPKLTERLGQQVIVDNRGGVLSMELVARAPADGYTLLLASGSLWLTQFKGMSAAMLSLMSGESHLSFPNAAAAAAYVRARRLNGLAVTSAQPSALAPGLPTVAASGLPGYESKAILGLFAPAKTAPAIIELLNIEIVRVLGDAEVKQRLFDSGSESSPGKPQELTAVMKTDRATTGKMIQETGIRAE